MRKIVTHIDGGGRWKWKKRMMSKACFTVCDMI